MKRCQKCSRTFPDENQKFCTFDGGLLMADQPTFDPNRTIMASQMESMPPVPPPRPAPAPPAKPSPPERDMSETIVAYRPGTVPETTAASEPPTSPTGSQTNPDLLPPNVTTPGAQTSSDRVKPLPPQTGTPTSPASTVSYSGAPTSRELPPLPPAPVRPPPPPSVQPPSPPSVQPPSPPPVQPSPPLPVQPSPPVAIPPPPPRPSPQAPTEILPQRTPPANKQAPPVKKKKSIVPWIIGILIVLLLGVVGLVLAAYIFRGEISQFLESQGRALPTRVNENSNGNSSTSTNTNANTNSNSGNTNSSANANESKKEPAAFVPPADAVKFTNAKDNLDGDLANHYVGFSFYYPKTWTKDPKAGISGSTSFAKVDRQFSDNTGDFIQERAVVTWYPSNGAYESDLPAFPEQATKFTKSLQNYEEVSHGETAVNTYKGYEVRFKGEFKNGNKSLPYWGRVIFLPPVTQKEKTGIAIVMLATSYAPGVTSARDVGVKGELAMILDSFRLTPGP